MKKYLKQLLLIVLIGHSLQSVAQMAVTDASTPPFTPENLISNIFLGDGVSIIDITYEGDPLAVGYFKDGEQSIGLDRGILLTSGRAAAQSCNGGPFGADCTGNSFSSNDMTSAVADADLNAISNGTPQDVAKYTITFQPFADTLRFRYVFASEEYPEFSCNVFNDVFGFFISGPGINGTFSNNGENIAVIPGTNTPVSIDNVHPQDGANCPGVNDQYYNNNNGIALQPVYDGYLDIFTAEAVVIPCETYTIKIMISDVGDNWYDSGVFLEAKSFGTGTIEVDAVTISLDGTITEGCSNGSFTFSLPQAAESDLLLDYTIVGDAENGVDYEFIASDLFIPQGDSSLTVNINGIVDDIDEGLESIGIDIQRDICNRDTFWIFIRDNEIVPPDLGPDLTICQGDSVGLDGNLPLPLPEPPSFTNGTNYFVDETEPVYSSIQVVGVQPITLGPGVIQSVCVNIEHLWVDDLDLYLISPGGQFIELSSMNGANCDNYNNVCFSPNATTPINYVFPWPTCGPFLEPGFSNGTFQPEGIWEDLYGDNPTNGTWQLLVLDESNGFDGEILDWTITFEPLYQLFYSWSPTDGLSCADCPDPMASPDQTTTYVLSAWDTYGCEVYDTINIIVEEALAAPVINCVSVTNNSIEFEWEDVTNATGYEVSVNGGAFMAPNNGQLSQLVTGLNLSEDVTIEVVALGPCDGLIGSTTCTTPDCDAPALTIDDINHVSCFEDANGLIAASATGGAGDYLFSINGSPDQSDGTFNSLNGGVYTITVIDSWGCPNTIEVTVEEPEELMATEVILNQVNCFGAADASVTLDITGGSPPYLVDWSNGQQQDTATNFGPGSHFVFVTDANNCTTNLNFQITQPLEIILTPSSVGIGCSGGNNGSVSIDIEGGVMPYSVLWDANAGNSSSQTVNDLSAGTYSVAVTDANGCIVIADVTIDQPTGLQTTITHTDVQCFGGSDGTANVQVAGGVDPYTYNWSNSSTAADIDGLGIGMYTVTVSDASGCTAMDSVIIDSPTELTIDLSPIAADCFANATGAISSTIGGGTPPYTYQWDNGQSGDVLQNVTTGTYCLVITDNNGCQSTRCETVDQPTELVLTAVPTNAACNSPEGLIDLSASGGTAPYIYNWSDGQTTEDAIGLLPGDYTVTVEDANGCSNTLTDRIEETEAITIDQTITDVLCAGENTGNIDISAFGGTGIYTYTWNGPNGFVSDLEDLNALIAGTYALEIMDSEGCSFSSSIEITEPAESLDVNVNPAAVSCVGYQDGAIYLEGLGGTPPYSYQLDSSGFFNNPNFIALPTGMYQISIQDNNGCLLNVPDIFVDEPIPFSVDLGDDYLVNYGTQVYVSPILGNIPDSTFGDYTYTWTSSNPQVPPLHPDWRITIFDAISPTVATLFVTNANGCTAEDMVNIFVQTQRSVVVPTGFTPGTTGPGENNLLHVHGRQQMVQQINSFQVFDRWGELVYEARDFQLNDLSIGWDGTFKNADMPAGVYVWHLDVDFIDGANETYKGHTTLIR